MENNVWRITVQTNNKTKTFDKYKLIDVLEELESMIRDKNVKDVKITEIRREFAFPLDCME